jgi:hypothetical protein
MRQSLLELVCLTTYRCVGYLTTCNLCHVSVSWSLILSAGRPVSENCGDSWSNCTVDSCGQAFTFDQVTARNKCTSPFNKNSIEFYFLTYSYCIFSAKRRASSATKIAATLVNIAARSQTTFVHLRTASSTVSGESLAHTHANNRFGRRFCADQSKKRRK